LFAVAAPAAPVRSFVERKGFGPHPCIAAIAAIEPIAASNFINANCEEHTRKWIAEKPSCNGDCVGVLRSKQQFKNFELFNKRRICSAA
jgi:hypothetical protein